MKKILLKTGCVLLLFILSGCKNYIDEKDLKKEGTIYYADKKPFTGIVKRILTTIDGEPFVQATFVMKAGIPNGLAKYFDQGHNLIGKGTITPVFNLAWIKADLPGINRICVERAIENHEIILTFISSNLKTDSVKFKALKPTLAEKLVLNGVVKAADTSYFFQMSIDDGEFPG